MGHPNSPTDFDALPPVAGSGREWIVEIPCRIVHTMTVRADSRKEAEAKLRKRSEHMDDFTAIDHQTVSFGIGRVICEDAKRNRQN